MMNCCAIDLFCGIGGLTKGLSLSGINVIAGFDIDSTCQFAYERNNSSKFYLMDIRKISARDLVWLYPKKSIKILVGCAPCQPFSKYSIRYRSSRYKDDKWKLLNEFSRLINDTLPHVVSMENVPGLSRESIFEVFLENLIGNKYYVDWKIVYCPKYGVPQNRYRLVLLASRIGKIELIPPLYDENHYPTVRQFIGSLPPLQAGEINKEDALHRACKLSTINLQRIRQSIPGGTWRDWEDALKLKCHLRDTGKSYASIYGRMNWDEPSPTITTQFYGYGNGRFGHPEQDRAISLREGAILQSFPKDYVFIDSEHYSSRKELGIHIGNAVPVELGRAIGLSIKKHIVANTSKIS